MDPIYWQNFGMAKKLWIQNKIFSKLREKKILDWAFNWLFVDPNHPNHPNYPNYPNHLGILQTIFEYSWYWGLALSFGICSKAHTVEEIWQSKIIAWKYNNIWGDLHWCAVQLQPNSRLPGSHSKAHCSHKESDMDWVTILPTHYNPYVVVPQ